MPNFPAIAPIPHVNPGPGRFPDPPPAPGTGGGGFGGPRSVSFTQQRPGGTLTLDALMARQKQAAAAQGQALATPQATIPGGIGQMLTSYLEGMKGYKAEQEEATGREEITQAMLGIPESGIATPEQLATIMRRDPDLGLALYQEAMKARSDAANAEQWTQIPTPEGETGQWYRDRTGKTQKVGGKTDPLVTVGGTDSKMSDWASNDAKFYMQGASANMDLDEFDTELTSAPNALSQFVPGSAYLTSPAYQKAKAAGDSWIMSVLRPESGGVIGEEEMAQHRQTYLPQPGEGKEIIEYKRQLRQQKTEYAAFGLKATAPNTWAEIQAALQAERELRAKRRQEQTPAPAPDATETPPPDDEF